MVPATKEPIVDWTHSPMLAEHDQVCHVCWKKSAVLNMQLNIFEPCWRCQSEGWSLKKRSKWRRG